LVDRQKALWAHVRRTDMANEKLVIFIHGFRGTYLSTWGRLADYLNQHADYHPVLREWDYLFLGYETYSIKNFLEIGKIVGTQWKLASTRRPPFDRNNYSQLALFGHSLGTLGLRQLLCAMSEHPDGMLDALKATVLFGSPLNGSSLTGLASLAPLLDAAQGKFAALLPDSYAIARALEPNSGELKMLHTWNATMRRFGKGNFGPCKVILGTDDHVVGMGGLATWDGDEEETTGMTHSSMIETVNDGVNTQNTVLDMLKGLQDGQ
jgi:hypothetical protein